MIERTELLKRLETVEPALADKNYRRRIQMAFIAQRFDANRRNIEFELTFEQWIIIWVNSGQLRNRGNRRNQYVMARFRDRGPYSIRNVRICTARENHLERNLGRPCSPRTRAKISAAQVGKKLSRGHRLKLSLAKLGRKFPNHARWETRS